MFAIAIGIGFLIVLAVVVGIVDAVHAARWRQVAADRRERWEARQPQFHGVDALDSADSRDEDDD